MGRPGVFAGRDLPGDRHAAGGNALGPELAEPQRWDAEVTARAGEDMHLTPWLLERPVLREEPLGDLLEPPRVRTRARRELGRLLEFGIVLGVVKLSHDR